MDAAELIDFEIERYLLRMDRHKQRLEVLINWAVVKSGRLFRCPADFKRAYRVTLVRPASSFAELATFHFLDGELVLFDLPSAGKAWLLI